MCDIFISYSHQDVALAEGIEEYLKSKGLDTWRDVRLAPGVKFEGEIKEHLESARICLFLMSQASLSSEYCQNEIGYADANEIHIFPVRLDECVPKGFLASRSYIDFSGGFEEPSWINFRLSLFDLYWQLREQLVEVLQDELRPSLQDFYSRLLSQHERGGQPNIGRISVLKAYFEEAPSYTRLAFASTPLQISKLEASQACRAILDYLDQRNPCKALFYAPQCGNYLPAWAVSVDSAAQANSTQEFSLMPDVLIPFSRNDRRAAFYSPGRILRDGDVIEAEPLLPTVIDDDSNAPETPYVLPKRVIYREIEPDDAAQVPWLVDWAANRSYLYVLSRGIYRLANVFSARHGTRVAITKYLGPEAARMRLDGNGDPGPSPLHQSNILEMMYFGCAGRTMEFLLFNDQSSIAIVRRIRAAVYKVTSRPLEPPPGSGATLAEYRFEVTLNPDSEEVVVTNRQFKYSPGDIDKFSIEFHSSEAGYDYDVSLKIDWVDVRSGVTQAIETPKERVEFPNYDWPKLRFRYRAIVPVRRVFRWLFKGRRRER